MKKFHILILSAFAAANFFGFTNFINIINNDNPKKISVNYSGPPLESQTVRNNQPVESDVIYYSDNFDLPSDTNGLKARGYLVYYRGQGSQNLSTWTTGNPNVFPAYNGLPNSYVCATFETVSGTNNIDSWMVLPDLDVIAGDVLSFRCRSTNGNTFPDSVRVMYNPLGGTTPESTGWIELGRFLANNTGVWELKSFTAPTTDFSARFAIRYCVVNGGPSGDNSNYIGIDALQVDGSGILPVELTSFTSSVSSNIVTLNWTTASETNNSGFDIERSKNSSQLSREWIKTGNVTGHGTSNVQNAYSFSDRNVSPGNFRYRLKQIDFNGNFEYLYLNNEVIVGIPSKFELSQNYPNPFNPSTKIDFQLPSDSKVNISVYDNSGKEVQTLINEYKQAGYYSINFNSSSLSSGVYYYKILSGDFLAVKKMILIK